MIRHVLTLCVLLAPTVAPAQTPAGGAPVVFFSIFGSNASELQRFHADVFEWKATSGGDITVSVTSPLVGTVVQRAPERLIYVGVADMTATLQRAVARGGTVRFLRLEVPGRVILGMFKDPAGNSIRLVEMENGKAKVPQWLVVRAWWFVGSAGLNREARITGVNLQGRTVLVTGGASGLGGAVVDMVAAAGGRAVILDLNEEKGRAKAERLGNTVRVVKGDVTQEGDVQRAVDMATADFGQLDGVVNAAGIPAAERVLGREGVQPLDHFTRVIHVNLVGTFNVIRLAAAAMDRNEPNAAGERGVIVNTASVAAFDGQIGQAAYSASKGGIVGMTLPIAREFARIGIRVMTIAPGTFDTPLLAALPEAARISLAQQVPFPSRLGRPDEYAALVRHIFENEMLNGEVIRIDGAIRMAPK